MVFIRIFDSITEKVEEMVRTFRHIILSALNTMGDGDGNEIWDAKFELKLEGGKNVDKRELFYELRN